jgi:hypothetical protein
MTAPVLRDFRLGLILTALALSLLCSCAVHPDGNTVVFSGYHWEVKDGARLYPGPNRFDRRNVRVDRKGRLHLRIVQRDSEWTCAELALDHSLGYGAYTFDVIADPAELDSDDVLGMFTYDDDESDHREIDIEWSKWGKCDSPNAAYTIQPAETEGHSHRFQTDLTGNYSRHRFTWLRDRVDFESRHGHIDDGPLIEGWCAMKGVPAIGNERVRINFWRFRGRPAENEQEIVIRRFRFTPQTN